LKNIVYAEAPTTRENMIEHITIACRNISRNVLLSIYSRKIPGEWQISGSLSLCARTHTHTHTHTHTKEM